MMERENKGASALDEAGNSYAVFDNQWVTYDSPSNVIEKVNIRVFLQKTYLLIYLITDQNINELFLVTDEIRGEFWFGRGGSLGCGHG